VRTWKKSVMALGLVAGFLYGKNAAAQNGVCVVDTQQIIINCRSGCTQTGCSCSSQTTLTEPSGTYGTGVLYQTAAAQCCGNTVSCINSPDGHCTVQGAPQPIAENRLVFLRGCDGRFRLYTRAG
jgi:hypothetical protein